MTNSDRRIEILKGTLDMLILRTLQRSKAHGHGIATSIFAKSDEVITVDHGSLYPALQRLQRKGWIRSEWGVSENNRRAKFYSLTASGERRLRRESARWNQFLEAISAVMGEESVEGGSA